MSTGSRMHDEDILDRYLEELEALSESTRGLSSDLEKAESAKFWTPTRYEAEHLPGLKRVGIAVGQDVVLQNVADLHVHTTASDGGPIARVLERALDLHLDAVAITDHDTVDGAIEARRLAHRERLPVAVVPGVEVSSAEGHIGALFVTQAIQPGLSAAETIGLIHTAGGLAVAHHPFVPKVLEWFAPSRLGIGEGFLQEAFDAVEVTNAVPGVGTRFNIKTHSLVHDSGCTLAFTGGSDAHQALQVGKGLTFYAGNQGVLSLRRGIELGTTRGAESYWKTSEKLAYYARLIRRMFLPTQR